MKIDTYKIINSDVLEALKTLPDECVQTVVTSPPYFGLRDYNAEGQIGLEATPKLYVEKMVEVFREVRRVLRNDGTLWLNLGDSYAGSNGNGYKQSIASTNASNGGGVNEDMRRKNKRRDEGLKPKDLIGIPWRVAFALQEDGWYLRQDIIWHKPNPMPESVKDRCTKAHEYIFLLSKSQKYHFDSEAIAEDSIYYSKDKRAGLGNIEYRDGKRSGAEGEGQHSFVTINPKKNKRSVWTVTTKGYKEAHFATFPEDLITPCILAGAKEGDIVMDIFNGSGTTGLVALKNGRRYLGIELNPKYVEMAERRLNKYIPPMFLLDMKQEA